MTTLTPRPPYSQQEIEQLYPKHLQLQLVQVLLRHGERSPVSPRFRNAGLPPHWPYCNAARRLTSVIMSTKDASQWDELKWRRRLEIFGEDDGPVIASGPKGEFDAICQPGELTDKGRETTLALGQRLRHLYVDQLGFMPRLVSDADMVYLRATPIPRALESVQQAFWGFYPLSARTADFPPPTIITRSPADETLYPNDGNCRRFAQLSRAFAQRAADRWNDTADMDYLNKKISKWMPENSKRVAIDSHPRLSGIMDTVNGTLAHDERVRLPSEFYDPKVRQIIDKAVVEEWYAGYWESKEYRTLGIGGLMGDIVSRMTGNVEQSGWDGVVEVGGEDGALGKGRGGEKKIKLAMSGCHDTTLAAILSSLGAFENEKWPPFTSHIAIELFRKQTHGNVPPGSTATHGSQRLPEKSQGWFASLFGSTKDVQHNGAPRPEGIARKRMEELTTQQKELLRDYYVRVRYNDKIMQVPGCKAAGKHLEGDTSFCTLEAFKSIVDKYTPESWKGACASNLGQPAFPAKPEPAGYEE
ncbi:putative acid phosphatase SPBC4.06 [Lasiodiplodia hormozganensis]|uniref:3-phytase n=1 Tax=Lasiodiplodia hormozganensis TaxID=869390 RepID=A0AA39YTD7_9PEZI|nr:putative acid phosphatase SPBC4.06 [Lasiodiplodia hormozganensis]